MYSLRRTSAVSSSIVLPTSKSLGLAWQALWGAPYAQNSVDLVITSVDRNRGSLRLSHSSIDSSFDGNGLSTTLGAGTLAEREMITTRGLREYAKFEG
jgi:hypothetical protein